LVLDAGSGVPIDLLSTSVSDGPTISQAPPAMPSQLPKIATARFVLVSNSRPPANAAAPGATSNHPRDSVHIQAVFVDGVYAKFRYGPMNGTIAAHAPRMTSSTPLVAPRVHGTRILLSRTPRSEEANLVSWPMAVIYGLLGSPPSIPTTVPMANWCVA
jgi:hypothetical protein